MPSVKHHKGKSSWVFLICFYCCFIIGGCLQQGVAKRGLKGPTHPELWRPTRVMHVRAALSTQQGTRAMHVSSVPHAVLLLLLSMSGTSEG